MIRLLPILVLAGALLAQGPGHSPTKTLETNDVEATQLDTIGTFVDPALTFTDERGYPFQLRQLFPGSQPVVLMLGYYACPAMCGQVLEAAFRALSDVKLQPGEHYRILNVSIDPRETAEDAKARKEAFLPRLLKTGGDDAWRVLVGDHANVTKLAQTVGFNHYWVEASKTFAHPPSLIFLTPQGKVSRIIVNTYFEPDDVRLAIVEASEGKLGTLWDEVRLNCLTFDPRTNTYSLAAMTIMRVAGGITVVVLALMIWFMLRKERRRTTAAIA